jgi:hypothetical protein
MLFLPPVMILVVSAIAFVFMSIQPLTGPTLGNVAPGALPTLHVNASPAPPASTKAHAAQLGLPAACAALQAPSSRWSWPRPPSRSSPLLTTRCQRRLQRRSLTHRR